MTRRSTVTIKGPAATNWLVGMMVETDGAKVLHKTAGPALKAAQEIMAARQAYCVHRESYEHESHPGLTICSHCAAWRKTKNKTYKLEVLPAVEAAVKA